MNKTWKARKKKEDGRKEGEKKEKGREEGKERGWEHTYFVGVVIDDSILLLSNIPLNENITIHLSILLLLIVGL